MGRTLWLDASAGIAGDMLLGALLDAGAPLASVQAAVDAVTPGSVRLSVRPVTRGGQRATKVDVDVLVPDPPHRTWAAVEEHLEAAPLHAETRALASAVFRRLAEAEGHVHGVDPASVHFHEVGALDAIADVVGTCEALRLLGVTEVVGTPVAVGSGHVDGAHGRMPVPVPAVAQLALGWPTTSGDLARPPGDHEGSGGGALGELATPTGMALLRALAPGWGPVPTMVTVAVGVGAGTRDPAGRANVVRAVLGHRGAPAAAR
nr:LarC family nickel insertion protein [Actinotalea sp. JY-7876]